MIHVSIIIVHHNQPKLTNGCLASLKKIRVTSDYNHTVLVVDNGSQLPFKLSQKKYGKNFETIRSESNLGFTGGNNLGIYFAIENYNSDFIVLLNNDTLVNPDFLKHMLVMAQENPQLGAISPKINFAQGSEFFESYQKEDVGNVLWFAGGTIDWQHLVMFHRGVDEIDRGHFDAQRDTDFLTGCCMLIRREVLEKCGTFDKRYFLYLEDVDLSMRMKRAGYEIGFCPAAKVWHYNSGSSQGSGSSIQVYYQTRNRLLFTLKFGQLKDKLTMARIAFSKLFFGSPSERVGVLHAITRRYGKQAVI